MTSILSARPLSGIHKLFVGLYERFALRKVNPAADGVLVTGCDSGIGLCFASHLASLDCAAVYAGVLDAGSPGARHLAGRKNVVLVELDVTDPQKVRRCLETVQGDIRRRNLVLSAVVNNAGVMVFGEFEWQTEELILQQINVNILGYMRVAKAFSHLLREFNGRLINVSSHCATVALPCLSVYSATKAAIESWSSALALEMYKFNVPVITIHPGSYVRESGILKNHSRHVSEMWASMSEELKEASGEYFEPIAKHLSAVSSPSLIKDPALQAIIRSAVFSKSPKLTYVNSPWRYSLYYGLIEFARSFWGLRRKLILSFVNLPKYR